ncbi:hypothetical protein MJO28_013209 [Puccinia striiformis f. sp. tritici]|uniref:Uncharacterized protein n=1 Tax=Puccinia striiformis f. sp. tritici TaxID=168172 RepID=A0ACC0DXK6_9BASI|nr:hypothetical protein MJO28_013209 [Puccinia striiformis f. sp. tritici]KAI7943038.1 hypothetical protein MJO29_012882 [Puccinia striiformis f. sp. tritici]
MDLYKGPDNRKPGPVSAAKLPSRNKAPPSSSQTRILLELSRDCYGEAFTIFLTEDKLKALKMKPESHVDMDDAFE